MNQVQNGRTNGHHHEELQRARSASNFRPGRSSEMVPTGTKEHTSRPIGRPPVDDLAERQRWLAAAAGSAMILQGFRQRNTGKWLLTLVGAGLLYQGVSGTNVLGKLPVVRTMVSKQQGVRVQKIITVNKPPAELYQFWRNLENLPRFMRHVKEVRQLDQEKSHWRVAIIQNIELEWDAHITVDRPNEMIAWETLPGATVGNRGYVKFIPAPGNRGTEVSVALEYDPPGAALGLAAGEMVKFIAAHDIEEDIRAFKRMMEAGEVPTTQGQPAARPEAWQHHEQRAPRTIGSSPQTAS